MHPSADDLQALLRDCARGHASAQRQLVLSAAPRLLAVARRYARTHAEADDLLQDALIRILDQSHTYASERGTPYAWMRTIVIRTVLAHYRKHRFRYETHPEHLPDTHPTQPDVWPNLAFEELCRLVEQLPDGMREVFNMAVFDEFSHEQIAAELGVAVGTSRSMLSRARKILQEKIQQLQAHELARI
jgi:RNA polymerase sigma factor (sigma-70 family)